MNEMFRAAKTFTGRISKWDVSRVKDMNDMFSSASTFKVDVSNWDVSRVNPR